MTTVIFIFTPIVFAVTLLFCLWRLRTRDSGFTPDSPELLLVAAVRLLPKERREWGVAMLAELAPLQHPSTRWRFALGCARVALFPPRKARKDGLLQTIMKHTMKSIITNLGSAALISFILVLPFAILEFRFHIVNSRNALDYIALFGLLWLLPTAFIVVLMPIARALRAGNSILANPVTLLFRVGFLAFIAMMWGGLLIDQLPCFLGVPNCD